MVMGGPVSRTTLRASKTPINTVEFSKLWKLQREVGESKNIKTKKERFKEGSHSLGCFSPAFPKTP